MKQLLVIALFLLTASMSGYAQQPAAGTPPPVQKPAGTQQTPAAAQAGDTASDEDSDETLLEEDTEEGDTDSNSETN